MIGQVTSCNKETCKPRKSDTLKRFRQKGILFLLVTLLLFAVALPGGLAAEIDELPETWEELCASLPDLPDLEIENVRVRFPNKSDTDFTVSFFCDSEGWSNASGVAGFTYSFLYDAEKSAYVMDDMSQEKFRMAMMTGTVRGYFALAKTAPGLSICFFTLIRKRLRAFIPPMSPLLALGTMLQTLPQAIISCPILSHSAIRKTETFKSGSMRPTRSSFCATRKATKPRACSTLSSPNSAPILPSWILLNKAMPKGFNRR